LAKVSVSAIVPAAPERTWALAADLSRFGEWLVCHEGWRSAVPAELRVGTELTSVVIVKGLRNRISWRIEDFEPPHRLTISGRGVGGTRVSLVLAVGPAGDRSSVAVNAVITGPTTVGPVGMLIGRALKGDLRRSVARLSGLLT
jgi:uncharacterized protein YndB with AHSA1/START domain